MKKTDFLIIGSGIAGLSLAIKLAEYFPKRSITIIKKSGESNTRFAQGGVAVVQDHLGDSFEKHIKDTLKAGDGLSDPTVVEFVVKQAPQRISELLEYGTHLDRDENDKLMLSKEGGHSAHRVVHHRDTTGLEIERALVERAGRLKNIELMNHFFAIDLIIKGHGYNKGDSTVVGAFVLNQKTDEVFGISAQTLTLATGGIGQLYAHTTNPSIATGDGIAMALRAGAKVKAMEFIQFHPTVFYQPECGTAFLISEALRGHGAYLRNHKGHRFVSDYDSRGELASRDIVSRAIDSELRLSKQACVYLDCTHLVIEEVKQLFPNIYRTCLDRGVDVSKQWIPVVPAVHYLCGGITVDLYGRSTLRNLFACGECSHTGLHGANRLASNSLLEALVYADSIFNFHKEKFTDHSPLLEINEDLTQSYTVIKHACELENKIKELQFLMSGHVGIVRDTEALLQTKSELQSLSDELDVCYPYHMVNSALCEYRNMLVVAESIIDHSLARKQNIGGYFNVQYQQGKQA